METHEATGSLQNLPEIKKVPVLEINLTYTDGPLGLGYGSIHAPETTAEEAEVRAQNMREYFVEVNPESPSDCIDGRCSKSLLNLEPMESARPGVAGGAAMTGYAAAELTEYFGDNAISLEQKFGEIIERLEDATGESRVIKVGGHVDEDAVKVDFAEGKTGCGAADKFIANLALLGTIHVTYIDKEGNSHTETDEELEQRVNAVKTLTKAVYAQGNYYDESTVERMIDQIMRTATDLTEQAKLQGWSGSIMKEAVEEKGKDRLVVLDTSAGGVHGHTERKVLFNYMDNTTFDQDNYFRKTLESDGVGREIFDVDVWHIRDVANKLANSPDETQAARLFTAGVAFQIATYLGLCDGSHRAYFAKSA